MSSVEPYPFAKGHGTENDFVLLPDPDGSVHGELTPERVRALTDRRAGIGGDGVLRVIRTEDFDKLNHRESLNHQATPHRRETFDLGDAEWFMDYRNHDGSQSEMCGNGVRVFGQYLVEEGLADTARPLPVATRDGIKTLTFDGDETTVDMGTPTLLGETSVRIGGWEWAAQHVDMGNPHAVAFVDSLEDAGVLLEPPAHDPAVYPDGVNVEFVVRRAAQHVAMRVHERGSGETRSCGTGACAVMVATALADGADRGTTYRIDLPGGTLRIEWTADDRVLMTGPAVIVGRGTTQL